MNTSTITSSTIEPTVRRVEWTLLVVHFVVIGLLLYYSRSADQHSETRTRILCDFDDKSNSKGYNYRYY